MMLARLRPCHRRFFRLPQPASLLLVALYRAGEDDDAELVHGEALRTDFFVDL